MRGMLTACGYTTTPLARGTHPNGDYLSVTHLSRVKGATVAGKCDVCGRGPGFGHNVSHSKRRTNRMFRLNVQRMKITQNGARRSIDICTRCIRNMYRGGRTA